MGAVVAQELPHHGVASVARGVAYGQYAVQKLVAVGHFAVVSEVEQHGLVDDARGHRFLQRALAVDVLRQLSLGIGIHGLVKLLAVRSTALQFVVGVACLALGQVHAHCREAVGRAVVHVDVVQAAVLHQGVDVVCLVLSDFVQVQDGVQGAHGHRVLQGHIDIVAIAHVEAGAGILAVARVVGGAQLCQLQCPPLVGVTLRGEGQLGGAAPVGVVVGCGKGDDAVSGKRIAHHRQPVVRRHHLDAASLKPAARKAHHDVLVGSIARQLVAALHNAHLLRLCRRRRDGDIVILRTGNEE